MSENIKAKTLWNYKRKMNFLILFLYGVTLRNIGDYGSPQFPVRFNLLNFVFLLYLLKPVVP